MFLVQQGWGMLSMMKEFIAKYKDVGIIFSPRVCEYEQLRKYLPEYKELDTQIFFDPQFYEPRTDLERIKSYPYWNNDFQTTDFIVKDYCKRVIDFQINEIEIENIILPGRFTNSINESWKEMHFKIAEQGFEEIGKNKAIFSTVALGPDIILDEENFNDYVSELINYPVTGIYLVYEHPNDDFLISDELFLYALLDGILSIVLSGKKVIIGYGNQQTIMFLSAGADYIASGNYRNVRMFDHRNFSTRDDISRKKVWYFDGNTFGEYRPEQLNLPYRRGLSKYFGPITESTKELLLSKHPGNVRLSEKESFPHYLELLRTYCNQLSSNDKRERPIEVRNFFSKIQYNIDVLSGKGFNHGDRGFQNAIQPTINALDSFITDRSSDIKYLL